MGNSSSSTSSSSGVKNETQLVMWGPWSSGKTTILYKQLKGYDTVTTISTTGFNTESVTYKGREFVIYDLGGREKLRPPWRNYFRRAEAIIYVVDSTDIPRIEEDVTAELASLLEFTGAGTKSGPAGRDENEEGRKAPVLVFANKQDLDGARSAGEIREVLRKVEGLQGRKWDVIPCCAVDGNGVGEGMEWLVETLQSQGK
ncbi:ADP-ribosylation factor family-domain-containing protein [Aspergillus egyptiacus]|nr:ADP-ribosylation factor family-domain-containing protein [Aspergillus egyptiacus]